MTVYGPHCSHDDCGWITCDPVAASAHHDAWTGLAPARRTEIQAEMLLTGVLYALAAGLWPRCAIVAAAVSAVAAARTLLFGGRS